jgi:hypothetical protein
MHLMIAVWNPNIPAAALFGLLVLALCISYVLDGIRTYRDGRELARQITAEHEARKALEKRAQ